MQQYSKLLSIDAAVDTYGYLAAVCSCTRMDIQGLPPKAGNQLLQLLKFLQQAPPALGVWPVPRQLHIPGPPDKDGWLEDRVIDVPKDLLAESFGQSMDLARVLEEFTEDFGELRRQALAIYLLPRYFNCAYDTDKLPEMLQAVDRIRLQEGLPVADFFILSLGESKPNTAAASNLYPSQLQSKRQGMQNLVRPGRATRWQTLWQEGTNSNWGRYLLRRWGRS